MYRLVANRTGLYSFWEQYVSESILKNKDDIDRN